MFVRFVTVSEPQIVRLSNLSIIRCTYSASDAGILRFTYAECLVRRPSSERGFMVAAQSLDRLDIALIAALRANPRVGALGLSREMKVARATVQSRLQRMEDSGIITGYGPDIDLAAAGHPVLAFVTLEIAQRSLEQVHNELDSLPNVLEAFVTTGTGDVLCKIAASSHEDLQETLLHLNRSETVVRSTSVMVLSVLVPTRTLPMLEAGAATAVQGAGRTRAPAYR